VFAFLNVGSILRVLIAVQLLARPEDVRHYRNVALFLHEGGIADRLLNVYVYFDVDVVLLEVNALQVTSGSETEWCRKQRANLPEGERDKEFLLPLGQPERLFSNGSTK